MSMEWISVKDRLPEYGQEVLVTWLHRFGDRTVGTLRYWGDTRDPYWQDVISWTPFPEPAKGWASNI